MENNTLRDLDGSDMSFYDCKDVTVNGETLIPASMLPTASDPPVGGTAGHRGTQRLC